MVKFVIEIEADAGDPAAVHIVLKSERNEATAAEETAARRMLPALRGLPKDRFRGCEEIDPEDLIEPEDLKEAA